MSAPVTLPQHSHTPGTARAALAYPAFTWIWLGLFASNVGTWMQNFTLPAYIDDRTESAALVGLLVFMQLGPLLLLSIPAGVLADRFPRRALLVAMQGLQMVFTLVLAALVATDSPLWTVYVTQLVIGVGFALGAPALQASVPLLVARQDLSGAVALNSVMINGSRVLGPSLAAVLSVIGVTISGLFVVNAATYLFLIAAIVLVRIPDVRGRHPERGWRRLLSGINIVTRRRVLSRSLVTMALFSLLSLAYIGLFPSVARLNFGIDPTGATYKWLYTVWGLGACAGALAVGTVLAAVDKRRLVVIGFLGFAVSLAAFALIDSPVPAFPVGFLLGFCYFLTATALITVVQHNVRDTERAVVMPLWFMAFGGTVPIGNLIFGPIIDAIGARPVMLGGAAVAVVLARYCDLRRLPESDFLPADEPYTHADVAAVNHHGIVAGD